MFIDDKKIMSYHEKYRYSIKIIQLSPDRPKDYLAIRCICTLVTSVLSGIIYHCGDPPKAHNYAG